MGFNGIYDGYPLVNVYIAVEKHHVWCENQLFRLGHGFNSYDKKHQRVSLVNHINHHRCPFPIGWLINRGVWRNPFNTREMMIDGIPNNMWEKTKPFPWQTENITAWQWTVPHFSLFCHDENLLASFPQKGGWPSIYLYFFIWFPL